MASAGRGLSLRRTLHCLTAKEIETNSLNGPKTGKLFALAGLQRNGLNRMESARPCRRWTHPSQPSEPSRIGLSQHQERPEKVPGQSKARPSPFRFTRVLCCHLFKALRKAAPKIPRRFLDDSLGNRFYCNRLSKHTNYESALFCSGGGKPHLSLESKPPIEGYHVENHPGTI